MKKTKHQPAYLKIVVSDEDALTFLRKLSIAAKGKSMVLETLLLKDDDFGLSVDFDAYVPLNKFGAILTHQLKE